MRRQSGKRKNNAFRHKFFLAFCALIEEKGVNIKMDNILTKINCEVPQYFNTLAEKYSMKFVKVTLLKTAIVAEKFILLI